MKFSVPQFVICHLLFVIFLSSVAYADEYLKDVPADHWASDAVYTLIKMGVTGGYPDGTYRGNKNISRYETASFLSRFASAINRNTAVNEKLVEELRSEAALVDYNRNRTRYSGVLEAQAKFTQFPIRGDRIDYRLKMSMLHNDDFRVNFDTLDAGYGTTVDRSITTKMVDLETKFVARGVNYKMMVGPGKVKHTEEAGSAFPAESGTYFSRPNPAIEAASSVGRFGYTFAYVARGMAVSGLPTVNDLNARFTCMGWSLRPRYAFKADGTRHIMLDAGMNYRPNDKLEGDFLVSAGSFHYGNAGLYARFTGKVLDPWDKGTKIVLRYDRAGGNYRVENMDKTEYLPFNNFDRLVLDGTGDLGVLISQKLGDKLAVEWKSDFVTVGTSGYGESYPGAYYLYQVGMAYQFLTAINVNAFYRVYNVPSGVAQFSETVPVKSDMIGLSLSCAY